MKRRASRMVVEGDKGGKIMVSFLESVSTFSSYSGLTVRLGLLVQKNAMI
jgi:hypothetical protein